MWRSPSSGCTTCPRSFEVLSAVRRTPGLVDLALPALLILPRGEVVRDQKPGLLPTNSMTALCRHRKLGHRSEAASMSNMALNAT